MDDGDDGQGLVRRLVAALDSREHLSIRDTADGDAEPDPTADGTLVTTVHRASDDNDDLLAEIYVQADRARVEFVAVPDIAANAAIEIDADLRVRPKAVRPPRTLVFVETDGQANPAARVVEAVVDALERDGP
jgi:hypothetical protein